MARRARILKYFGYALLFGTLALGIFAAYLDVRVRNEFEGRRFALPARIYARPLELHAGLRLSQAAVEEELRGLGYKSFSGGAEPGWFTASGSTLQIAMRPFVFWDGAQPARTIAVSFDSSGVAAVQDPAGKDIPLVRLEPRAIGGIYPSGNEDRVLVRLTEVPPQLVQELIAVEDHNFYFHFGFDPRALARAALSLLSGHVQGGSTITQQLVKNFFLTPERTIRRKFTELIMAVLLEAHYSKDEILETYLNEIYLGQDRDRAIHGVGLAAEFYFGKEVRNLTVAESALLVALVRGPAYYDPRRHPARALERRNLVLREARERGYLTLEQYALARATDLGVSQRPGMGTSPYPAFLQLVHRQLRRDYDENDLRSEGLRIFTTLDPRVQAAAEAALAKRLAQFDREKRFDKQPGLEGAVVVTDPQSGEVQALVGGRDPRYRGYNRAIDAARPVGSLLKPAIYLTALSDPERYTLVTPIDDGPFTWKSRGAPDWQPQNYDRQFHGMVPLRTALAQSYNAATARLGTQIGLDNVLASVKKLGVERDLRPFASTLLGATEMTPLEVAQMYQTIASGGFRSPLRAIREVTTQEGQPLQRYGLKVEQAFPPEPIVLITAALQGVVREGTAQGLKNFLPPEIGAAGKTGTTDEQRDAWFAGFTGDHLAVVWVGYDDNRPAKLLGASSALPVWGDLMAALSPEPLALATPETVERVWIDPQTNLRADSQCAGAVELPFIKGSAPQQSAPCASAAGAVVDAVGSGVQNAKSWFERMFGK
jgi:penicillin-binding protein 1B